MITATAYRSKWLRISSVMRKYDIEMPLAINLWIGEITLASRMLISIMCPKQNQGQAEQVIKLWEIEGGRNQ